MNVAPLYLTTTASGVAAARSSVSFDSPRRGLWKCRCSWKSSSAHREVVRKQQIKVLPCVILLLVLLLHKPVGVSINCSLLYVNERDSATLAGRSWLWPCSANFRLPWLPQRIVKALRESQTETAAQVFNYPLLNQFQVLSVPFQGAAGAPGYRSVQLASELPSTLHDQEGRTYLIGAHKTSDRCWPCCRYGAVVL